MDIYIDCEFNGFEGELISMALVDENDNYFYEVLPNTEVIHPWVEENVMPFLFKERVNSDVFQMKLQQFLHQYESVHIIADWPDDIRYFCQYLITGPGEALITPPSMTMEIDRNIDAESRIPHNALSDAQAIKEVYKELYND